MVEIGKAEIDSYVIVKTLGTGTFGTVKKAEEKENKIPVALKILMLDSYSTDFAKEASILQSLKHKHITQILKVLPKATYKKKNGAKVERDVIAMEFAERGSLFNYIVASTRLYKRGFPDPITRRLFHQMVEALEFCHNSGVIHRDIKPENILLDTECNVKLADFGIATLADKKKHETITGTEGYQAPEMLSSKSFELEPTDVFVLGVMLFMLKAGTPPFSEARKTDPLYRSILDGKVEKFWSTHSTIKKVHGSDFYSEDFKTLCCGLLNADPEARYKIEDIKSSAWYKSEIAEKEEVIKELDKCIEEVNKMLIQEKEERRMEKLEKLREINENEGSESDQGSFNSIRSYRGANEKTVDERLEERGIVLDKNKRKLKTYPGTGHPLTCLEVHSEDLEFLFKCIILTSNLVGSDIEISKDGYKLTMNYRVKDEIGGEEVSGNAVVKLFNKDAKNEYVIEYSRVEGSYWTFLKFFGDTFTPTLRSLF